MRKGGEVMKNRERKGRVRKEISKIIAALLNCDRSSH